MSHLDQFKGSSESNEMAIGLTSNIEIFLSSLSLMLALQSAKWQESGRDVIHEQTLSIRVSLAGICFDGCRISINILTIEVLSNVRLFHLVAIKFQLDRMSVEQSNDDVSSRCSISCCP